MVCLKPTTFDDFVKVCIEIDNTIHENKLDKHHAKTSGSTKHTDNPHTKQASATPAVTPQLPQGEPMQIDATKTKWGPLSQMEWDHRHANGLCMYCRGKHSINECPNMSETAKKCFADNKKTSPSSGKA